MREAIYNPEQVYELKTNFGNAAIIELELGEELVTDYRGDSTAWEVDSTANFVALRPATDILPNTNLILISNFGRKYVFDLKLTEGKGDVYGIKFMYPKIKKEENQADKMKAVLESSFKKDSNSGLNFNYFSTAKLEIAPIKMYDDGTFTYIQLEPTASLPAVFAVDRYGEEQLVNTVIKDNWLILSQLSPEWRLRHGKSVVCILRGLKYQSANMTKTNSDLIKRIDKE